MLNALCKLFIYRENTQLISNKLWEQVIHILDLVQNISNWVSKYIILSTKVYYSVQKYIIEYQNSSDHALKYIRLHIKIF